jgi:hypothetical protein
MIEFLTIVPLFDRIRSICKECAAGIMPSQPTQSALHLDHYLKALDHIKAEFMRYRTLEDDYERL